MAETTADVRRDIELTRERMSDTIAQLEQKMNVMHIVKDHPWPSLALAAGAGFLLANSRVDVKAAAATVSATGGASGKLGELLDDLAANLIGGVTAAFNERVDGWVNELKQAIGAPTAGATRTSRPGVVSRGGASSAAAAVDRHLLGAEENAPRTGSASVLGVDRTPQDSGAIPPASMAH